MDYKRICDNMHVPDFFQVASAIRVFPIGFAEQLRCSVDDNCAIHVPLDRASGKAVCKGAIVGSHPSIRALYDKSGVVICHAEEGARGIDAELARLVFHMDDSFVIRAHSRSKTYQKRYMMGSPVGVSIYGAGYCYLRLIDQRARSRVARLLGPLPLVSDVIRFVIAVGNMYEDGFYLQDAGTNLLHVDSARVKWTSCLRAILGQMLNKVEKDSTVRIGIQDGLAEAFHLLKFPCEDRYMLPVPTDALFDMWCVSVETPRVKGLKCWLLNQGIQVSDLVMKCLLVATTAGASIPVDASSTSRQYFRMWAIVGDAVAKYKLSIQSFAEFDSPEQYSNKLQLQKNVILSRTFVVSGLRDVSAVTFLKEDSKANADIVEAVVGVFCLYSEPSHLNKILRVLGFVSEYVMPESHLVGAGMLRVPELNSSQYAKFVEMYRQGVFGL